MTFALTEPLYRVNCRRQWPVSSRRQEHRQWVNAFLVQNDVNCTLQHGSCSIASCKYVIAILTFGFVTESKCVFSIFTVPSHDSYPFLRMQLLNFQVSNTKSNQLVNLATIKTQIELREKHRATRNHVESTGPLHELQELKAVSAGSRTHPHEISRLQWQRQMYCFRCRSDE